MLLSFHNLGDHWLISEKSRDDTIKRGKITFLSHTVSIFFENIETKIQFKELDSLTIATLSQKEINLESTYNTNNSMDRLYWKKIDTQEKYLTLKSVANQSTLKYDGKEIAKLLFKSSELYQLKIEKSTIPTNVIIGSFLPVIL
ncbi:MAG TPA: hypothetical protein VMX55_14485 [candidate division Zixibacteria bacterium]|nr:hypothetical protein [candidate division Zixibacteria bacterium]